jgi:hypothetical protein
MKIPPPDDDYWNTIPLRDAFMAWRQEVVSVERVESQQIFGREHPVRADWQNWRSLKQQMQPGDELWTFTSPRQFWQQGMGWEGVVLVRLGICIDVCVTSMN